MRRILALVLAVMTSVIAYSQDYPEEVMKQYDLAVEYTDNGEPDKAIEIYKELLKKYPKSSDFMYEMALTHYTAENYNEAIKVLKKAEKLDDAFGIMYAIHGNCLDMLGKTKEALAVYKKGISKFPDCGQLYVESGVVLSKINDYDQAVNFYLQGIKADPYYTSNYFRISQLLCQSNEPVMGIIYGEILQLLQPGNDRADLISALMYHAYADNITLAEDGSVKYSLSNANFYKPEKSGPKFTFEPLYDFFSRMDEDADILKEKGKVDLNNISERRKQFLTSFFKDGMNKEMLSPLFKFQQKVLEDGHWEAYNMYLFREGDFDEFVSWVEKNEDKWEAFAHWMGQNHFDPKAE